MKTFVIYGAPASGKTNWVKERLGKNDIVYDFDDLMQSLSGLKYQQSNENLIGYVKGIQELIIKKLKNESKINNAYIITTFLSEGLDKQLEGLDTEYIKMETGALVCLNRLKKANHSNTGELIDVVSDWYSKYKLAPIDNKYADEDSKAKFYGSAAWRKLRLWALERDNYECQECKRQGYVHVDTVKIEGERKVKALDVHHILEIERHPEYGLEIDNLEVLCLQHHNDVHNRMFGRTADSKWNDEKW